MNWLKRFLMGKEKSSPPEVLPVTDAVVHTPVTEGYVFEPVTDEQILATLEPIEIDIKLRPNAQRYRNPFGPNQNEVIDYSFVHNPEEFSRIRTNHAGIKMVNGRRTFKVSERAKPKPRNNYVPVVPEAKRPTPYKAPLTSTYPSMTFLPITAALIACCA